MAWFNASWMKRKALTVSSSLSPSTLTNFPLDVLFTREGKSLAARNDYNDIVFTDADETTKLDHQLITRRTLADTAWTWFTDPRVRYYAGGSTPTYYGGGMEYVNQVGGTGSVIAWSLVPATGVMQRFVLAAGFQQDDHDCPASIVLPSGKIVYFYALHGDATGLRMRISTNAEDISAFGSQVTIPSTGGTETSYANPYLIGTDIYVFYRQANYNWAYVHTTTTNILTNTWDSPVTVFGVGGGPTPYQRTCLNANDPTRIDILQSDNHPVTGSTSAFHMYATSSGGTLSFFNSAGTPITLPATTSTMTKVHDAATSTCWIWDISTDSSGNPAILYTTFPNTSTDHRYWTRRFSGGSWGSEVQVVAAGGGPLYATETYYTPGICFDGNSIDIIYAAVWVSGQPEIQKYETFDAGATWSKTVDITSGTVSGQRNIRPVSPRGHTGTPSVFYCSGAYTSFTNWNMNTAVWPPFVIGAHVRVPTYTGGASKTIYCYYGNAGAAVQENPSGVWDSNYKRVFRAQEPIGDITSIIDETGTANAAKRSAISPLLSSGALGPAGQFASGQTDHWSLGASSVLNPAGWTAFTVEAFVNFGGTNANLAILSNWDTSGATIWLRASGGNTLQGFVRKTSNVQVNSNTVSIASGDHYVALAFDTTDLRVQRDGTESTAAATGAALAAANSAQNLYVGRDPLTTTCWDSLIYEVRISNIRRSVDWRNATRLARMDQATYVSWGSEEDQPPSGITGTAAVTLGNVTTTAVGSVSIRGAAAITLGAVTASATGTLALSGAAAITLGNVTLASTATLTNRGALAATLGNVTLAATGGSTNTGQLAVTLGDVTTVSAASLSINAQLGGTLDPVTLAATGSIRIAGSLAQTLGNVTLASTGVLGSTVTGQAAITLGNVTSTSTGTLALSGAVGATLGNVTLSATGKVSLAGSAAIALGNVTSAATGSVAIRGAMLATLGNVTLAATGGLEVPTVDGPAGYGYPPMRREFRRPGSGNTRR